MIRASEARARANKRLLLVAARQRKDVVVHVGGADGDAVLPGTAASASSRLRRDQRALAQLFSEPTLMFSAIDIAGRCHHSADRPRPAPRTLNIDTDRAGGGRPEYPAQQIGLAMTGKAGKPDDFAFLRDELGAALCRTRPNTKRRIVPRGRKRRHFCLTFRAAHGHHQLVAVESRGTVSGDDFCRPASPRCGRSNPEFPPADGK